MNKITNYIKNFRTFDSDPVNLLNLLSLNFDFKLLFLVKQNVPVMEIKLFAVNPEV